MPGFLGFSQVLHKLKLVISYIDHWGDKLNNTLIKKYPTSSELCCQTNPGQTKISVVTQRSRSSFFIGSAWVAPLLFLGLRQLFGVLAYCVFNQ